METKLYLVVAVNAVMMSWVIALKQCTVHLFEIHLFQC